MRRSSPSRPFNPQLREPNEPIVRIRNATPDDIALLMRLERECPTAGHWTEQQYRDLFADAENASQRLVFVAEPTGKAGSGATPPTLVGFLVARHMGPEWELENIVVARSARRRGTGKRLLEALLSAAHGTDSVSVFLEVRESNNAARGLYAKLGFRETGRRKSYYASPLEDAVLYSLILG